MRVSPLRPSRTTYSIAVESLRSADSRSSPGFMQKAVAFAGKDDGCATYGLYNSLCNPQALRLLQSGRFKQKRGEGLASQRCGCRMMGDGR